MDFVENIFGITPDGGNGMFELMLLAIPLMILASLVVRWKLRENGGN
ncbi:MAG: hypothetical protein P8Y71_09950 [Pseudolabrys sp.]|jgi:hypothetical protein